MPPMPGLMQGQVARILVVMEGGVESAHQIAGKWGIAPPWAKGLRVGASRRRNL